MSARLPTARRTRNWKRVRASNLREAIELCLAYALEKQNRGVDRVADLMGLASKFTLYKWLESARLPAIMIPPFEHACGAHFVTEYLGHTAHKLVIDMPLGKAAREMDIAELQAVFSEATTLLIRHYQGQTDADETVAALTRAMGGLAWQRENVAKSLAPELSLFGDEE